MPIERHFFKMEHQNPKHRRRRQTSINIPSNNHRSFHDTFFISASLVLVTCWTIYPFIPVTAQQNNFLLSGHNLDQLRIPENTPIDTIVYTLKAQDKLNEDRKFNYHMTGDVFRVDERTGEVRLIRSLDRERQANVTVVVSVFDDSPLVSDPLETRRRTVIVEDVDDSPPIFIQHKYSMSNFIHGQHVYQVDSLSEQAGIGSIVIGEIQAQDADDGLNAEIVFECRAKQSTNAACDTFSIESRRLASGRYSVTIKTKALLDYERVPSYKLSLVARGRRPSPLKGVPLETEASVNINILNVQDEGPVFVNAPYSLSMEEGYVPGTKLLNLMVQDGDAAPQRELSVIVAPGPYSQYFRVKKDQEDSRGWYLETNETIDRENPLISNAGNMFTISLLAAELSSSGEPVASEMELVSALHDPTYAKGTLRKENVTIIVVDVPDSQPVFLQASTGRILKENLLVVNISEYAVTGSSVPNLDLAVQDLDQGINSRFRLSLIDLDASPVASQAFALESEIIYGKAEVVLNILNSSLLDYENPSLRTYKFNLVASKNAKTSLVQILEVQINIMDANDNAPEFDQDQYVFEVPEGSSPGTLVTILKARDRDSGLFGKIDYMLKGVGASKFKLFASEGRIVVGDCGLTQCLDYEIQPSFLLTYEAHDGGGRTKNVSVIINVIDINDHAPKFTEPIYKRELISDNLSSKQSYISPQLIVRAKDLDGPTQGRNNVTYRIRNSNLTSLDVDPVSGLVYISQPLDLNSMIVSSKTAGMRPSSDSRDLNFYNGKKIVFEAEVVAEDNGSPMLNSSAKILLVVKGNRDGAPQFKQEFYDVSVKEDHPINKPFFQVQAIDPDEKDSQLRYSLGYDLNDLISINAITGDLSFKSKLDYDDYKGEPYNVTVIATDNNRPYPLQASALVSIAIVDVNNKAPKFLEPEYKATLVQGQTKPGATILKVNAVDPDKSSKLEYSIDSDLAIGDRNGQQFTLEELANSTKGYMAQMSRQDRLQLVNDLRKLFQINKKTGEILLRSEPDYSFAASITIIAHVVDSSPEVNPLAGEPQQDSVICIFLLQAHVDRSPIFAPPWSIERREYNITILEELPIGTQIFSLLAKDPVSSNRIELFEKLSDSDPRDFFRVERSGIVSINRIIDYEELVGSKLFVSVKAISDEIYASVANLNIQVIDINDNAPQFKSQNYTVSVNESVTYPSEIMTVSAEDKDSNEYGQVFYSLSGHSSDLFTVHQRKGIISVRKAVHLDRDTEPTRSFLVTASDCNETRFNELQSSHETGKTDVSLPGCRKSSVLATVILIDDNDNSPIFANVNQRGEYEALTSETVSVGSVITQVRALDADEGQNGQVSYEIVHQPNKMVKIDHEGFISAAESLSGMGRSSPYRVTIRAFDHGKVSRDAHATLLLTIRDVVSNDGVPKFVRPRPDEVITLSENAGPNTLVYQVQAVDPDEESNGKLMYKFIQPSDTFEIDPFSGIIKTPDRPSFYLDREQVPNYTLIIVAQDLGSPPKQAHQVLSIKITDVNDNEPYFERGIDDPPAVLYVEEEVPKDTLIGTIQAIDKDAGQHARIGYEILEGNSNNLFRLVYEPEPNNTADDSSNNPCRIYSTGRLDRELKDSYTLTIKATSLSKLRNQFLHTQFRDSSVGRNTFNATDLTKIRVTIKLVDINDNRPVFAVENPKSVVDSSAEIYSQLMVFRAIDADSSDSDIQYSIVDALYHSDAKLRLMNEEAAYDLQNKYQFTAGAGQPVSMRHVFDIDSRSGILRNSVSLRPYIDGYFEVFVKADSGSSSQLSGNPEMDMEATSYNMPPGARRGPDFVLDNKCYNVSDSGRQLLNQQRTGAMLPSPMAAEIDNCYTTVIKAIVFVTHQRETFRFVFNKTKLNDRLDEFKYKVQKALEEFMFEPSTPGQPQISASLDLKAGTELPKAEKVYLNTFNTDYYEREDGSMDFSTVTSCSQLVKFDDKSDKMVPNQVINYDEVLDLLKKLNATQIRNQKSPAASLFNQYGLVNIERCLPDRAMYRMSLSERLSLYFAAMIAVISILLAVIVSRMRKSYEKNLKLLQRSKYQYMGQYGLQQRPAYHMNFGTLPNSNFVASPYGSQMEYPDGPAYDTWQNM